MTLSNREKKLKNELQKVLRNRPKGHKHLSKEMIRNFHRQQRINCFSSMDGSFEPLLRHLKNNISEPREISIENIEPILVPVLSGSEEAQIFKATTLTWSVPVSQGFGRRMRFLVKDKYNGKLIGIIGLTDPVFNLKPRDQWVGWSSEERKQRLIHVMDAFVLGAVPPYSFLLGGKLVALLSTSVEVVQFFRNKYGQKKGIISRQRKDPRLVLLTTTSALGRSSLYNRLKIPGGIKFLTNVSLDEISSWYTQGYGHFHLDRNLFLGLQELLLRRGHPYATGNRFGDGPNWRMRVIRKAAEELDIKDDVLNHGIKRQVYVIPLAENTRSFLLGKNSVPRYQIKTVDKITEFWKERWAKPRSVRFPKWRDWSPSSIIKDLRMLYYEATLPGGVE